MWWGAVGALLLLTLACCCWYGRDVPVEKPERGLYSFQEGHKHVTIESRVYSMRSKEPVELEALSDRLVIASYAPVTYVSFMKAGLLLQVQRLCMDQAWSHTHFTAAQLVQPVGSFCAHHTAHACIIKLVCMQGQGHQQWRAQLIMRPCPTTCV